MGGSIISCNVPTSNFIIWQLMTWNLVVIASVKMTHKKRSFHRVKEGCTLIGGGSSLACCVFNSRSNSISTCQIQYLHILASSSMPCHSTFMSPSMTCWCWKYWRPFPLKSHKTLNQSTSQVKKIYFMALYWVVTMMLIINVSHTYFNAQFTHTHTPTHIYTSCM